MSKCPEAGKYVKYFKFRVGFTLYVFCCMLNTFWLGNWNNFDGFCILDIFVGTFY